MRDFRFLFFILNFLLLFFITGCNTSEASSSKERDSSHKACSKCNMELPSSNIHTAKILKDTSSYYFDDIGCLVLWAKDKNMDIDAVKTEVFTNDTHRYIESSAAYFTISEKTPMNYGFSAYEHKKENSIKIDEVKLKMLRGEHMANPKIRKQILGQ